MLSTVEAGQTVYVRVNATSMSGQTVSVTILEKDTFANDTIQTISVTINSSGYGTAAWTAKWIDDGVGGGDPEYILRASGTSDSAQLSVTDKTGPSAPALSAPADAATMTSSSVAFTWGSSNDSASGSGFRDYTLEWANNSAFSSATRRTGLTTTNYTDTVSADGTYYWRVYAYDKLGNPTVSSPASRSLVRLTPRITGLSWRSGSSSGASTLSAIEAGQTVYVRVDATGMASSTVQVTILENDPVSNDTIQTISVTINSSGYGTAAWTAKWTDDGVGGGDPEYILRASGTSDSAQLSVTDKTGPSAPALSAPADAATMTSSSVAFTWGSSNDSASGSGFRDYTLEWANNSAFSSATRRTGLTTTNYTDTVSADGTYYWRVYAYDKLGNPTVSSPASRSLVRLTPRITGLSWRSGSSSGASTLSAIEAGQTVYVRVDATGMASSTVQVTILENDPVSNDTIQTISVTINSSGYGTAAWTAKWTDDGVGGGDPEYFLRVNGATDSAQLSVTDKTGPSAPALSAPSDAATVTSNSVAFAWGGSSDSASGSGFRDYTLEWANNSAFSSSTRRTGLTTTNYSDTVSADGTYYWRVYAYDKLGNATVSSPASRSFTRLTPRITALSWRSDATTSAPTLTSVRAGQPAVIRIDSVGMAGGHVSVSIYESDPLADDFVETINVPIGADGVGFATWAARWLDDGVGGGDPEFLLRAAGVADSALLTVTPSTGAIAASLRALSETQPDPARLSIVVEEAGLEKFGAGIATPVRFEDLAPGTYHVTGKYQSPTGHTEYWSWKRSYTVAAGATTAAPLIRNLPYVRAVEFAAVDAAGAERILGPSDSVNPGSTVKARLLLANPTGSVAAVRWTLALDRLRDATNDVVRTGTTTIAGSATDMTVEATVSLSDLGSYSYYVTLETDLEGFRYTDSWSWNSSFGVFSVPPPQVSIWPRLPIALRTGESSTITIKVTHQQGDQMVNTSGASVQVFDAFVGATPIALAPTDANGETSYKVTASGRTVAIDATEDLAIRVVASRPGGGVAETTKRVRLHNPKFGVTAVTHGYLPGAGTAPGWLYDLAIAMLNRAGRGKLWLMSFEESGVTTLTRLSLAGAEQRATSEKFSPQFVEGSDASADASDPAKIGEQVIIYHWGTYANNTLASPLGHAAVAGHALEAALRGGCGEHAASFLAAGTPLHLIAHSFGTVVISEAARRLAAANIEVDQLTVLDPHDFDESWIPVDGAARLPNVNVWENVRYADDYFATKGGGAADNPHGRAINHARTEDLTDFDGFYNAWLNHSHSNTHGFYHGTVNPDSVGHAVDGLEVRSSWYSGRKSDESVGFTTSRLGGRFGRDDFPTRDSGVVDYREPERLPDSDTGSLGQVNDVVTYPERPIFNGDFALYDPGEIVAPCTVPGFLGATELRGPLLAEVGGGQAMLLSSPLVALPQPGDTMLSRVRTVLTYLPATARQFSFRLRRGYTYAPSASDDYLEVAVLRGGTREQVREPIRASLVGNSAFATYYADVSRYAGQAVQFEFTVTAGVLVGGLAPGISDSNLYLDDLGLVTSDDATVTVAASPANGGSVQGGGTFTAGTTITLTATAGAGFTFVNWSDGVTSAVRQITVPVGGANYTANFSANTFLLSIDVSPRNAGTVTVAPVKTRYDFGEVVMLSAQPATNNGFYGWTGYLSGANSVATLTMTTDKSVGAIFSTLDVTPARRQISAGGGELVWQIAVSPGIQPEVALGPPWLRDAVIASTDGQSGWSLTLVADVNPSSARTGYVDVVAHGLSRRLSLEQAAAASGYQTWLAAHFAADEMQQTSISGPTADPDHDGLSNLLEYAFGLDPRSVNGAIATTLELMSGGWTLTYARPADRGDVVFTVETSADLKTWTTAGVSHALASTTNGIETWRASYPTTANAPCFFRIVVTR